MNRESKCQANLIIFNNEINPNRMDHSHDSNSSKAISGKVYTGMKADVKILQTNTKCYYSLFM